MRRDGGLEREVGGLLESWHVRPGAFGQTRTPTRGRVDDVLARARQCTVARLAAKQKAAAVILNLDAHVAVVLDLDAHAR